MHKSHNKIGAVGLMKRLLSFASNRPVIQIGLLVLGAVLIALGLVAGEADAILQRAIFVCLECIGLG